MQGDKTLAACIVLILVCTMIERVESLHTYSRDDLLRFRDCVYNFEFPALPIRHLELFNSVTRSSSNDHKQQHSSQCCRTVRKRGKRAGLLVRFRCRSNRPPLPAMFLSNVRSLDNKKDELFYLIKSQRDYRDCSVYCFTETWLKPDMPDAPLTPPGFTIFRADRSPELTGKELGGGICFLINNRWCTDCSVLSTFCSSDLETITLQCRPFYLPREFTSLVLVGVYVHPRANATTAMRELSMQVTDAENKFPDCKVLVMGDFNHSKMTSELPKYKQQIKVKTRGDAVLDHCYTTISGAFKSISRPPLGRSDHAMVYLLPSYRQRLKMSKPRVRSVRQWNEESIERLQDCLDSTDWNALTAPCRDIHEKTDVVTSYIAFCEEVCVPTRELKTWANDKPWFTNTLRTKVKVKDAAYKGGNVEAFKQAKYDLQKEIKRAKWRYRCKMQSQLQSGDTRAVWQGLQAVTDYKKKNSTVDDDPTLPDRLNNFYARFDRANTTPVTVQPPDPTSPLSSSIRGELTRCACPAQAAKHQKGCRPRRCFSHPSENLRQ